MKIHILELGLRFFGNQVEFRTELDIAFYFLFFFVFNMYIEL